MKSRGNYYETNLSNGQKEADFLNLERNFCRLFKSKKPGIFLFYEYFFPICFVNPQVHLVFFNFFLIVFLIAQIVNFIILHTTNQFEVRILSDQSVHRTL